MEKCWSDMHMDEIKTFQQLRTWQEGHSLVLEIYRLTKQYPSEEKYGLVAQIRSAAASIPANIAEGMGRRTTKDLTRFLVQARGSLQEVIYHLLLSKDLGYIPVELWQTTTDRYEGLNAGINAHILKLSRHSVTSPLQH